jgi:HK97 gp10 family phage protein
MSGGVTGLAGTDANRGLVIARNLQRRSKVAGITNAIAIDATGFMADLQAHLAKLEIDTEDDLVKVGLRVQSVARSLCPVDTGRLRSSIVMRKGRDGLGFYVEVGTSVSYAAFVEFGTSKRRAQPFLTPAIAQASGFLISEAAS